MVQWRGKTRPRILKHFPESKLRPRIQKYFGSYIIIVIIIIIIIIIFIIIIIIIIIIINSYKVSISLTSTIRLYWPE